MKKSNVIDDNLWTFMNTGQQCYNYSILNACPPPNPAIPFNNQIIKEELFNGNVLFSINDLNPMWLSNNMINPLDAMALQDVIDIMFPMGFFNNENSWAICNNNIEDCHGFITSPNGFNLNLTSTTILNIFKASAVNNDRAGYSLEQNFMNSSGGIIGTATINRILARKPNPNPLQSPLWGFFIKKEHNICNQ